MKTFKVEGWYRYNDEKDFWTHTLLADNIEDAITKFKKDFYAYRFYKIDIKEIV
jgi:ribosomal protein L20A (L18A)